MNMSKKSTFEVIVEWIDRIFRWIDMILKDPILLVFGLVFVPIVLIVSLIMVLWETKAGRIILVVGVLLLAAAICITTMLSSLHSKLEEHKLMSEIELSQLETLESYPFGHYRDWDSEQDSLGNIYTSYFDLCSYEDNYGKTESYSDFATNGEYMYLEGTIFCRRGQNPEYKISFRVYADGELVYDSGEMSRDTPPKQFKVCINQAQVVRIQSSSSDYTLMEVNPGIILVNAKCTDE